MNGKRRGPSPHLKLSLRRVLIVSSLCIVCALVLWSARPLPLTIVAANCRQLHDDHVCEVEPGTTLRVFIPGSRAGPPFIFGASWRAMEAETSIPTGDGWLLSIKLQPRTTVLRAITRQGLRPVMGSLRLRQQPEHDILSAARADWMANRAGAALNKLTFIIEREPSLAVRAQAYYLRSRVFREGLRPAAERQDLRQAFEEARQAGLLTLELDVLLALSKRTQLAEINALMAQSAGRLQREPGLLSWWHFKTARVLQLQDRHREALAQIAEGERWAHRLGDAVALSRLASARANTYEVMGRTEDADREYLRGASTVTDDCSRAFLLNDHGWARLRALAAQPAVERSADKMASATNVATLSAQPHETVSRDPRPPLSEALSLFRSKCKQLPEVLNALVGLAQAEALFSEVADREQGEHLRQADAYLAQIGDMLAAQRQPPSILLGGLLPAWVDAQARVSLVRRRWEDASRLYYELLGLAREQPALGFAARVGLARATEATDPERAETLYRTAQEELDVAAPELPLGTARESLLSQYEQGTGAFIWLLHQRGRDDEAFAVLRRARLRGLKEAIRIDQLNHLTGAQGQQWEEILGRYYKLRQRLEAVAFAAHDSSAPVGADERPILESERWRLVLELETLLGGAPTAIAGPDQFSLRPIARGEALLSCHPTPRGWLCFTADQDGVEGRLVRLEPESSRIQQAQELLLPFWTRLKEASVIRVLSYGKLRQVDVHLLPFPGNDGAALDPHSWLGQLKDVVYALDQPMQPAPAPGSSALAVWDPQENLRERITARAPAILSALRAQGFTVVDAPGGMDAETLRRMLPSTDLFLYLGHAANEAGGRLVTANAGGFLATDVLALKRVPSIVQLFGCTTGVSADEAVGVEGLGIAQAMILRGARQVLATVRPVPDEQAIALAVAMSQASGLTANHIDLVAALRQGLQALSEAGLPTNEMGAFRVFVP